MFAVRQQTIGAWERGDRPNGRYLPELANYLGMELDELTELLEQPPGQTAINPVLQPVGDAATEKQLRAATMRQLAASFIAAQSRGTVPLAEIELMNRFINYFES